MTMQTPCDTYETDGNMRCQHCGVPAWQHLRTRRAPRPDLFAAPPSVSVDECQRLLKYLAGVGWVKAPQIKTATGLSPVKVRAIASASDGQIVALPQKGYRLTAHAAPEDIRHAVASLRSRGHEITRRADETERRAKDEGRW